MSEEIFKPENFHFYEDGYPKDLQPFEACAMANAHIKPIIEEYERQLIEKSKEIGRAEHRGNTVDFIYDKVKIYSDLITKLQSDRSILIEALELIGNALPPNALSMRAREALKKVKANE